MSREPAAPGSANGTGANPDARRLVELLRDDAIDAAIDAGLMACSDDALRGLDEASRTLVVETRRRLQAAWDARARYRSRQARLARRKPEREARRAAASPPDSGKAGDGSPTAAPPVTPGLPAAAAAALARAKARAGSP